ncbi:MAG: hypothetical protein RI894_1593 [Bacteroidota bacterium]|jgi:hypothetical protein
MNNDHLLDFGIDERPKTPLVPHLLRYYGATFAVLAATVFCIAYLDLPPYLFGVLGLAILLTGRYWALTSYFAQNELKNPREIAMTMAKWQGGISVGVVTLLNSVAMCYMNGVEDIVIAFPMGLFGGAFAFFLEIVCTMLLHTIYIEIIKKNR